MSKDKQLLWVKGHSTLENIFELYLWLPAHHKDLIEYCKPMAIKIVILALKTVKPAHKYHKY